MSEQPATPAAPSAPATPEKQAPAADSVTLPKAEVDQLRRDAARAADAQARADRLANANKRSKTHFDPSRRPAPPSPEEVEAQASAEDAKAERGLMRLATNPEYREILDSDPTLRDLLTTNPLAVLPIYAADAMDADDAIDLVKQALAAKIAARKPAAAPTPKEEQKPTPPVGGVNPPAAPTANPPEYEEARKNPNTEVAIASMVAAKMKAGVKK